MQMTKWWTTSSKASKVTNFLKCLRIKSWNCKNGKKRLNGQTARQNISLRTHEVVSRVDSGPVTISFLLSPTERLEETCTTPAGYTYVIASGPLFLRIKTLPIPHKAGAAVCPVRTISDNSELWRAASAYTIQCPPRKPTQYLSLHQHSAFPPRLCGTLRPP